MPRNIEENQLLKENELTSFAAESKGLYQLRKPEPSKCRIALRTLNKENNGQPAKNEEVDAVARRRAFKNVVNLPVSRNQKKTASAKLLQRAKKDFERQRLAHKAGLRCRSSKSSLHSKSKDHLLHVSEAKSGAEFHNKSVGDRARRVLDKSRSKKIKPTLNLVNEVIVFVPKRLNTKFPVDDADSMDEFCCSTFAFEIYEYLYFLEERYKLPEEYLLKHINGRARIITPIMRSFLIDWIIQTHRQFHLLPETLYLTVKYIDCYLQAINVPSSKLQLLGIASLYLASKLEEMFVPDMADIIYMTDGSYTKQDILRMEENISAVLDFEFSRPIPLQFLRRYSKIAWVTETAHCFAKYLMELSLTELEIAHWKPSYLAACALYASKISFGDVEWTDDLIFHSTYHANDLKSGAKKLATMAIHSEESMWQATREKFVGLERCPLSDFGPPALKVLRKHLDSNSSCFN